MGRYIAFSTPYLQYRRPLDTPSLQLLQRLVCVGEGEGLLLGADGDFDGQGEQFLGIAAGGVGDATHGAFAVDERVIELRDGGHIDTGQRQRATAIERSQRLWHKVASGRKDDRRIERGGVFASIARPGRAMLQCQSPMRLTASEDVYIAAHMPRHLDSDMR